MVGVGWLLSVTNEKEKPLKKNCVVVVAVRVICGQ